MIQTVIESCAFNRYNILRLLYDYNNMLIALRVAANRTGIIRRDIEAYRAQARLSHRKILNSSRESTYFSGNWKLVTGNLPAEQTAQKGIVAEAAGDGFHLLR